MTEPAERTFEQAQAELEQVVERLERGQAPLDEALKLDDVALVPFAAERSIR